MVFLQIKMKLFTLDIQNNEKETLSNFYPKIKPPIGDLRMDFVVKV